MNPLELRITQLEDRLNKLEKSNRFVFEKDIEMSNGRNFQFSTSTGTKIGTGTTQKIGFFNKTPVVQQSAISSPSGGATVDSQSRSAIDSIRTALINLGLTA